MRPWTQQCMKFKTQPIALYYIWLCFRTGLKSGIYVLPGRKIITNDVRVTSNGCSYV